MPQNKLSIDAVAQEAFHFMSQNRGDFLRLAVPLIILWMITALLADWWQARSASPLPLGHTVTTLIEAAFTMVWFRLTLQSQPAADQFSHTRSRKSLVRMVFRSLMMVIGITILVTPVAIFVAIGLVFIKAFAGIPFNIADAPGLIMTSITITMFMFSPLLCRLLPYYAAVATGHFDVTPLAAWRATRGNSLRLWGLCIRLSAPWIILSCLLERLVTAAMNAGDLAGLPGLVVQTLTIASLSLVAIAVMVSGVAAAMKYLPFSEHNIHI